MSYVEPERIPIRDGASTLGWGDDERSLTIVTPGAPDEVAVFSPRTDLGGYEFVVSSDERYVALFIYSGQSSQGYELFELQPVFAHIGGIAETGGEGTAPVFSPNGRWLILFMTGDYRRRDTGEDFEEFYHDRSGARAVIDWACLHVMHLPDLTLHSIPVGVEIPLSTDPDVYYYEWNTYDAAWFTAEDVVVLRMPGGPRFRYRSRRTDPSRCWTALLPGLKATRVGATWRGRPK